MTTIYSFPPIVSPNARILLLGSMPGKASLQANQYYAHPRNQFWPLLAELMGFDAALPYALRIAALRNAGIAVWDVLQSCQRSSSLDADIAPQSMIPNDFQAFFSRYPQIEQVFFNGATAEQTFRRRVLTTLPDGYRHYQRLPSTSPAHASLSYQQKLQQWRAIRL